MKNVKNYSAEVEERGHAGNEQTVPVAANHVSTDNKQFNIPRIEEGHKLVRRYSFDDNGGGYAGL
jgi:hypothetical protein